MKKCKTCGELRNDVVDHVVMVLLVLLTFGALNAVWSGLGGPDLFHMAWGPPGPWARISCGS